MTVLWKSRRTSGLTERAGCRTNVLVVCATVLAVLGSSAPAQAQTDAGGGSWVGGAANGVLWGSLVGLSVVTVQANVFDDHLEGLGGVKGRLLPYLLVGGGLGAWLIAARDGASGKQAIKNTAVNGLIGMASGWVLGWPDHRTAGAITGLGSAVVYTSVWMAFEPEDAAVDFKRYALLPGLPALVLNVRIAL